MYSYIKDYNIAFVRETSEKYEKFIHVLLGGNGNEHTNKLPSSWFGRNYNCYVYYLGLLKSGEIIIVTFII